MIVEIALDFEKTRPAEKCMIYFINIQSCTLIRCEKPYGVKRKTCSGVGVFKFMKKNVILKLRNQYPPFPGNPDRFGAVFRTEFGEN